MTLPAVELLRAGRDLASSEMTDAMRAIMSGQAQESDIADLLVLLRQKGESVGEIVAAARVLREHGVRTASDHPEWLDTCGTGGDASRTLNVSTIASFLCAAAGARVAKHGNRSVSGVCGSADLLEALGVPMDAGAQKIERGIAEVGWGFLFAPLYHPAVKHAMAARKRVGGKTVFNLIGPLSNPTGAGHHLLGVYSRPLVRAFAEALKELGCVSALIVHGEDGLDEISISAPSVYAELSGGQIREGRLEPEDVGIRRVPLDVLRVADAEDASRLALDILGGASGPASDIVCLNAGAGLRAAGLAPSIAEGYRRIVAVQRNGGGLNKLQQVRDYYGSAA
ncbi:MAG: Anthranilate phosphoribosyltransferase [Candidatus Omnitrophica bacterium]|nr:Anthranilate phosphoribosyltransferase [Candidatus Omnitrophota bacterium]